MERPVTVDGDSDPLRVRCPLPSVVNRPWPVEGREEESGGRQHHGIVFLRVRGKIVDQWRAVAVPVAHSDRPREGERDHGGGHGDPRRARLWQGASSRMNARREEADRHREREDVGPADAERIDPERARHDARRVEPEDRQAEEAGLAAPQQPDQTEPDERQCPRYLARVEAPPLGPAGQADHQQAASLIRQEARGRGQRVDRQEALGEVGPNARVRTVAQQPPRGGNHRVVGRRAPDDAGRPAAGAPPIPRTA